MLTGEGGAVGDEVCRRTLPYRLPSVAGAGA